jgi:hypothetical protein
MTNEKQILNELGDTLKGKIKLLGYLNSRSKDLESLEKEAKRLDDVKQTHMGNIRKGRIPSDRVIDTLYKMGVNLTTKEGRYKQGMKRAVGALGLPFLREDNSTTIKEDYKQILLNEIGDTERGREMLKRYVRAARRDREEALWRGNDIYSEIQDSLPRTGALRDASSDAYHAAEEPANKLFRRASRRRMGILGAYKRLLGINEHSGELLNELGDTQRGKMALARYLTARLGHREKLKQEAQRMLDLGRRHTANFERGYATPSQNTINAYSNMVDSLARRRIRYGKGMERAAAALMTPILQENNSMTIKEHYKEILNERIFNAANPLGRIETGIRKLINPTDERAVKNTRHGARVAVETRNRMATQSGGRVPSARAVEINIADQRRDIARQNYLASQRTNPRFTKIDPKPFGGRWDLDESNLLNEIGDTERGQKALRAYIGARVKGIQGIERENKRIDSSIRQVTDRLRGETTNTDEERQRGMQLVNMERKNNRKIGRYKTGIDHALARIRPS